MANDPCRALEILMEINDANYLLGLSPGDHSRADRAYKGVFTRIINHLSSLSGTRPDTLFPIIDNAKQKMATTQPGIAVDYFRDRIHQDKAFRTYFLGGEKFEPQLAAAMEEYGRGDSDEPLIDMAISLQNIIKEAECAPYTRFPGEAPVAPSSEVSMPKMYEIVNPPD